MRIPGHIAVIAASLLAATPGVAEELRILGNHRVDEAAIKAHLPSEGGRISEGALNDFVKSLYASGQFEAISVSRKDGAVIVEVSERHVVASVRFTGNERLKAKSLAGVIALKPGEPLKDGAVEDSEAAVARAYVAAGRPDAVVTGGLLPLDGNRVDAVFHVKEGERTGVSKVWFKGNDSFVAVRLKSLISTKERGLFSWFLNNDIYDFDRVAADRTAIESFYAAQGYPHARVLLTDVDRLAEGFVVGFVIDEGERHTVSSSTAESTVAGFESAVASEAARKLEGKPFTPQSVRETVERIEAVALGAGFPSATVEAIQSTNADNTVDLVFNVDDGVRAYIQRIDIEGNVRTHDHVIRRELDFAEGDMLNKALVAKAERRLRNLGIFDKASVSVRKGDAGDQAILTVSVSERKTGEFSVGGGYSTKDGALFSASLSQANLGGSGRKVHLGAGRSDDGYTFNFSFTEPYLFGNRITSVTEVFRRVDDRKSAGRHAYDETSTGSRLAFMAPVTENLDATVHYGLQVREIDSVNAALSGTGSAADPDLVRAGTSVKSSFGYGLVYDGLDNRFDPRDGIRLAFEQEFAGLGGDVQFLKSEASADWYSHMLPDADLTGRLGAKAGHVSGLGKPLDFQDHFRSGTSMIRGFEVDGIGPRDAATGYHLGGTMFLAGTAEVTMPLPVIPPEYGVKGAVFADAATIWNPDSRRVREAGSSVVSEGAEWRASVGTGILWNSPFGQLRADFAVPVARRDGDRTQVFSFTGGTRF